jgi:uncharacterized protein
VNSQAAGSSIAHRLDRLRATRGERADNHHRSPPSAAAGRLRAEALAAGLGGRLIGAGGTPVVIIEHQLELPVERRRMVELPFPVGAREPLVCLDLETTGLGTGTGTLPLMAGLGSWHGDRLHIVQLILPDHAAEDGFLAALAKLIPPAAVLVTYNGRSFDWPLLVARYTLHRRSPPEPAGHLDLLAVARGLWRHRTGDARLATVEREIGGIERGHDLPGAAVPERYFAYLSQRRPDLLADVVTHNRQDIISLGRLVQVLAGEVAPGSDWGNTHPGDLAGLARAYARRGRPADALACLEAALGSAQWQLGVIGGATLYRRLATERAITLGRLGRRTDALAAWRELAQRGGPGAATAWIRLAIDYEHVEGDHGAALDACRQAADICARSRAWGRPLPAAEGDLRRRMTRLQRRLRTAWLTRPAQPPDQRAIA